MDGCTDGTWRGQRFFTCRYGRAFFCPVTTLQLRAPDSNIPPLHEGSKPHPHGPTENLPREPRPPVHGQRPPPVHGQGPLDITVDSAVQIGDSQNSLYGVVKWVGNFPGSRELIAGIELVSVCIPCTCMCSI